MLSLTLILTLILTLTLTINMTLRVKACTRAEPHMLLPSLTLDLEDFFPGVGSEESEGRKSPQAVQG